MTQSCSLFVITTPYFELTLVICQDKISGLFLLFFSVLFTSFHSLFVFLLTFPTLVISTKEGHICRPSILSLATCIYLGGVTRTQFLCVITMEPLLGLINSRTSCEFTYGPIKCECLVHYEVQSWSFPWLVSFYGIEVEVSTTLVKLETMTKHTSLFQSFLPHPSSELCTIFLLDSLFFKEHCIKI